MARRRDRPIALSAALAGVAILSLYERLIGISALTGWERARTFQSVRAACPAKGVGELA